MERLTLICVCLVALGCGQESGESKAKWRGSASIHVSTTLETADKVLYRVDVVLKTDGRISGLNGEQFRVLCENLITAPMNQQLQHAYFEEVRESGGPIMEQVAGYGAMRLESMLEEIDYPTHYQVQVESISYRLLSKELEAAYEAKNNPNH